MALTLAQERFWVDKSRFDTAERQYYETLGKDALEHGGDAVDDNVDILMEPEQTVAAPPAAAKLNKGKKPKKTNKSKVVAAGGAGVATPTAAATATVAEHVEQPVTTPPTTGVAGAAAEPKPKKLKKKNKNKEKLAAATVDKENVVVLIPFNNNGNNSVESVSTRDSTVSPLHLSAAQNARNNGGGNKNGMGNASKPKGGAAPANSQCTLVSEIAKAREHIKNSLEKMDGIANLAASPVSSDVLERINHIEKENADLRKIVESMRTICLESQKRIISLEQQLGGKATTSNTAAKKPAAAAAEPEDDDGVDLFASDSEEENDEASRIREQRLAAYAAKKSKKPALIAKSSLVLDVKPWDDETDLKLMEAEIRKITADGLLWGASKFVPVAFGIQKLSISCVVEDDKISIDWLSEEIEKMEDYVQSVDVAAFNKI